MQWLLIGFIWILNFGISWWNAYSVGKAWVETKHYGGWPRFMAWIGAIQSASGFSWCYLIVLALLANQFHYLSDRGVEAGLDLGYILIIPGVLFSGLMIMVDSWAQAYRQRTLASVGTAAYNTFAQIYNTYNAIEDIGPAFKSVVGFFGGGKSGDNDDDEGQGAVVVLLIVALALAGGIVTTAAIIKHTPPANPCRTRRSSRFHLLQGMNQ